MDTEEEISRLTGGLSEVVSNVAGELGSILITALGVRNRTSHHSSKCVRPSEFVQSGITFN